jgi:hypothetical protein
VHKAADVYDGYFGLSVPLGVAENVLGNENDVSLGHGKPFSQINIRALAALDNAESGLSLVTVAATEVVIVKRVARRGELGEIYAAFFHASVPPVYRIVTFFTVYHIATRFSILYNKIVKNLPRERYPALTKGEII